jgi:anhydro-N-acetylmuramic acid kinase
MLKDPYFARPAPKSTGKEYFNLEWLNERLSGIHEQLAPEDIQATLIELTACTIAEHINHLSPKTIYVFGGGVKNARLMTSLQDKVAIELRSTSELGIEGDYMEAAAFAWLAKQRINNNTGSLSSVTGSSRNALCGALYCPSP